MTLFELGPRLPPPKPPPKPKVTYDKVRFILENRCKGLPWLTLKTGLSRQQVTAVAYQDRYVHLVDRALADIKEERERR